MNRPLPRPRHAPWFAALALALGSLPAQALVTVYTGTLAGSNENPPSGSPGTGEVRVTVNDVTQVMRVEASFSGLLAPTTAAHIHCCAAPDANAGVATPVPTFPGFPGGVTAGSYDQTFDMTLASSFNPGFVTDSGGTIDGARTRLFDNLDAAMAYFNVHSTQFPGGEIRANLAPIPEPSTYALMAFGLAALALAARRRRG